MNKLLGIVGSRTDFVFNPASSLELLGLMLARLKNDPFKEDHVHLELGLADSTHVTLAQPRSVG